ncbi:dnaj homolog subfamily c member 27-like [Stylonychia lemnae]|uniref:Dnaj homolog subfamily c member 27-like n=1 Tax=Stylonychia lemnae TaxID=5949 RepID=A0A078A620_STYLE|nr:dnaj homolog subfamily c member 27-like [Stylonychia lemnae]|eukprot:CDW77695.1 dnaj homolog subfamily c member 27-like [Stylonychia lemnae]
MVERPNPKIVPDPVQEPAKVKIVVVGEPSVGKTCLSKRFALGTFNANEEKTIGSDFYSKTLNKSATIKANVAFTLWDLSGDQTYVEVRNEFYKDSQVLMIVYDVTNKKSFDAIDMWLREVSKYQGEHLQNATIIVGNKSDQKSRRAITKDDAESWTKQRGFFGYYETSSSEGNGFNQLFQDIATSFA